VNPSSNGDRFEGVALVLILLGIGGVSAAASFTHIHDWTMANSPAGTGDWFGWANAVVSDLVPLGVGLEVRRRRRHKLRIGAYPITIILAAAALSLAGQLAQARPSITGWLLAAVPALGFLALTKLVLSRPMATSPVGVEPEPSPVRVAPFAASTVDAEAGDLIPGARIVADAYRRATGHVITREALAERLQIPLQTAARLLDVIAAETAPAAG
jgi:hypothetical protein